MTLNSFVSLHDSCQIIQGHERDSWAVAFSPDGELLATAGVDLISGPTGKEMEHNVKLWNPCFLRVHDMYLVDTWNRPGPDSWGRSFSPIRKEERPGWFSSPPASQALL